MNGIKRVRGKEFGLMKRNVRLSGIFAYSDNRADSRIREGRAGEKESKNTGWRQRQRWR